MQSAWDRNIEDSRLTGVIVELNTLGSKKCHDSCSVLRRDGHGQSRANGEGSEVKSLHCKGSTVANLGGWQSELGDEAVRAPIIYIVEDVPL